MWARNLAATTGPTAVTTTKRQLVADLVHHSPQASVDESLRLMDLAMGTAEYAEGIAAFSERRAPRLLTVAGGSDPPRYTAP